MPVPKKRCAFCKKKQLIMFECDCCKSYFCMTHRMPEFHQCVEDYKKKDVLGKQLEKVVAVKVDKI